MNAELEKWINDKACPLYFHDKENDDGYSGRAIMVSEIEKLFDGKVLANEVPMMKMEPFQTIDKSSKNYAAGWNACRLAMLAASQEKGE